MICPSCGDSAIRFSQHSYGSDAFQSLFGRMPYRCRKCRRRFYSSQTLPATSDGKKVSRRPHLDPRDEIKSKRKRLLRGLIAIAIFAAMFIIFLMILNYLTSEKGPPKEVGELRPSSANVVNADALPLPGL